MITVGCLLAVVGVASVADEPKPDVGFVAKGETLPNAVVTSDGDVNRLKPLLESLPDGHRLELEFVTVPKAVTNYKDDLRYARRVTAVDAAGKPDGLEIEFHNWYQPPIRKTTYKHGVRDGVEELFHPSTDQKQSEIPWKAGQIEGVKKTYHVNGVVAGETPYVGGKTQGEARAFTAKGALLRKVRFVDGKRDGESVDYWPDSGDKIDRVIPYRKGMVDGVSRSFYLDGKPKWEKPFRNNLQHGIEKQFAPDGMLERERHWIDGDAVSAEEFQAKYKP
jgi:antitoxin component YwqK of YwqJK toxin-antitoxin module